MGVLPIKLFDLFLSRTSLNSVIRSCLFQLSSYHFFKWGSRKNELHFITLIKTRVVVLLSSERRAAREKVKLCELIIFSLLNMGFRPCFSLLPRPPPTRVLDVLCLTRKIRDCSQSKKNYQESWLFHPLHLLHFACGKISFFPFSI